MLLELTLGVTKPPCDPEYGAGSARGRARALTTIELPVSPRSGFARCFRPRLKQAHASLFPATKTAMSSVERMPTG